VDIPFGRQPRGQGVLTRAAANHENSHGVNDLGCDRALHARKTAVGVFR
jgi:hypothetical protein